MALACEAEVIEGQVDGHAEQEVCRMNEHLVQHGHFLANVEIADA